METSREQGIVEYRQKFTTAYDMIGGVVGNNRSIDRPLWIGSDPASLVISTIDGFFSSIMVTGHCSKKAMKVLDTC